MKRVQSNWLAVVAVSILTLLLAACGNQGQVEENTGPSRDPEIVVINESGQNLFSLIVTVSGQEYIFQNVPDQETAAMTFQVTEAGQFQVRGFLQDGTPLNAGFGSVAPENDPADNDVTITVRQFGFVSGVQ